MKSRFFESSCKHLRNFEVSGSQGSVTEDSILQRYFAPSNRKKIPQCLRMIVVHVSSCSRNPKRIFCVPITEATVTLQLGISSWCPIGMAARQEIWMWLFVSEKYFTKFKKKIDKLNLYSKYWIRVNWRNINPSEWDAVEFGDKVADNLLHQS